MNVASLRSQFPAVNRILANGKMPVFLDSPGGTQWPTSVIDAVANQARSGISNLNGQFVVSQEANESLHAARCAVADLYGCESSSVSFGQNVRETPSRVPCDRHLTR